MAKDIGPRIGIEGEAKFKKELSEIIQEAKTEKLKSNIVIFSDGINQSYQFKPFDGFK